MTTQDSEIREKIMEATIDLIKQYGDTTKITIRDIAAQVGVGVGLINYHFQTKDNLINQCILKMIGNSIENLKTANQNTQMTPIDKLRYLSKGIAAFMVINPGLSRVSMVNDIAAPRIDDNSARVAEMLLPIFKEIYGDQKTDQQLYILLHMLITSIEIAFLRREVIKETTGIDFNDDQQRDAFIDFCINGIVSF